jgi:hypothetical protein
MGGYSNNVISPPKSLELCVHGGVVGTSRIDGSSHIS